MTSSLAIGRLKVNPSFSPTIVHPTVLLLIFLRIGPVFRIGKLKEFFLGALFCCHKNLDPIYGADGANAEKFRKHYFNIRIDFFNRSSMVPSFFWLSGGPILYSLIRIMWPTSTPKGPKELISKTLQP
jgi:hypothetical protein